MKPLFTVADVFEIHRRGSIVIAEYLSFQHTNPCDILVELRRPDGSRIQATLTISFVFQRPSPAKEEMAYIFYGLEKTEIPVGTEVWFADE